MKKYIYIILIAGLFSACTQLRTRTLAVDSEPIYKSGVLTKPMVAEVNIEKRKIEGVASVKNAEYPGNASEVALTFAIRNALKSGNADFIVQPLYDIENTKGVTTAKVSGYAGKYKVFREFKLSDTTSFYIRRMIE